MSYFNKFPKVDYRFLDNKIEKVVDIFRHVKIDQKKYDPVIHYQNYMLNGERPDLLSYQLYGTTDFYWTFFIVNDRLRDGLRAWYVPYIEHIELIKEKYPGHTMTFYQSSSFDYNSIYDKFPIGTVISGETSGAAGIVTGRNPLLNQLVFEYTTDSEFIYDVNQNGIAENINGVYEPGDGSIVSYSATGPYDVREYVNSVAYYTFEGERYTNFTNEYGVGNIVTNLETEKELNENNRKIRVVRKEYIYPFTTDYMSLING